MRKYETIFVIDSLLKAEEIDNIVNKYERFISANGGKIEDIEHWGKKRLAYEIKKRQYGYYVLIRFEGPATMIRTLEREYRLNESLLRYKTLLMENASIEVAAQAQKPQVAAADNEEDKVKTRQAETEETPVAETTDDETEENKAADTPAVEVETNEIDAEDDEAEKEE